MPTKKLNNLSPTRPKVNTSRLHHVKMWMDSDLDEKRSSAQSDLSGKDDCDTLSRNVSAHGKEKTSSVTEKPVLDKKGDTNEGEALELSILLSGFPRPPPQDAAEPKRVSLRSRLLRSSNPEEVSNDGNGDEKEKGGEGEAKSDATTRHRENMWRLCDSAKSRKEVKVWKETIAFGRENLGDHEDITIWAMQLLSMAYIGKGQFENASIVLETIIRLKDDDGHAEGCDHDSRIHWSTLRVAAVYRVLSRYKDSLKITKKAVKFAKKRWGKRHRNTIDAVAELIFGDVLRHHRLRALMRLKQMLPLSRKCLGEHDNTTIFLTIAKARIYSAYECFDEELELRKQYMAWSVEQFGTESSMTVEAMEELAFVHKFAKQSTVKEAITLYEQIIELQERLGFGVEDATRLNAMDSLASCFNDKKDAGENRKERATTLWEEVLDIRQRKLGPDDPCTMFVKLSLADCYHETGNADQRLKALQMREEVAKATCKEHSSFREKFGFWHIDSLSPMLDLAQSFHACGRKKEAWVLCLKYLPVSSHSKFVIVHDDVDRPR